MKAPRDILKHVSVEIAKAKRKCHRNRQHQISKGERCLVIQEGSFAGSKNYCVSCALDILSAASSKHAELKVGIQQA